jgi:hypothetical protein
VVVRLFVYIYPARSGLRRFESKIRGPHTRACSSSAIAGFLKVRRYSIVVRSSTALLQLRTHSVQNHTFHSLPRSVTWKAVPIYTKVPALYEIVAICLFYSFESLRPNNLAGKSDLLHGYICGILGIASGETSLRNVFLLL